MCIDADEIELDLSDVGFIDSTGMSALLSAKAICAEHYAELVVMGSAQRALPQAGELGGREDSLPRRGLQSRGPSRREPWHRLAPRR
jgi:hypothetical protein